MIQLARNLDFHLVFLAVIVSDNGKCKWALFFCLQVVHLRQRLDNAVSSSRDRAFPLDTTLAMIQTLIDCDEFQDIATLRVCYLSHTPPHFHVNFAIQSIDMSYSLIISNWQ